MKKILLWPLQRILKLLARWTIAKYKPGVVGITGSVGKTSTREAVATVLRFDRCVRSAAKNFNNELGLPLAVLGDFKETAGWRSWGHIFFHSLGQLLISKDYPEILVLEYGVDAPGDMRYLLEVVRPQIGILTALGDIPVHVEFFSGPEGVLREKAKLISQLPATGFSVLNADDEAVRRVADSTRAHTLTFGFSKEADVKISNFSNLITKNGTAIVFKISFGGNAVPVRIEGVVGRSQAYAAAAGAAVGIVFGQNLVKISEALTHYVSPRGRLKIIPGIKKSLIIDDTYNSSPLAALAALETLRDLKPKRAIAVLGDMLELGEYTIKAHTEVGERTPRSADFLITVGSRAKIIAEAAVKKGLSKKSVVSFNKVEEAGRYLQNLIRAGDVILVKASQGVRLEKIVKEVMAEPRRAGELLVRQEPAWLAKQGMYD